MWYNYLRRDQKYLKSWRTHNLWLDNYHKLANTQRIQPFHIAFFKRMAKTYSGQRIMSFLWGITFFAIVKFSFSFKDKPVVDRTVEQEIYNRLQTIFSKNKFGHHTRIMNDFNMFMQATLNEEFFNNSTAYYDDPVLGLEIEDVEKGLNSDMAPLDIAQ